jgi:ribonuclease PH
MSRPDGRSLSAHRPVEMSLGFHRASEGSVLYRAGGTVVLATASIDEGVPDFLRGKGSGWLTAEYQMHPRANPPRREAREGRGKALGGRTQEIQRLIGRALRASIDLGQFGERTLTVDCDVLEADGGTRTASVTAGFVALVLALATLRASDRLKRPVLRDIVAAISVGLTNDGLALDLVYTEDRAARVDLNLVCTGRMSIVEVQGTAEGEAVPRKDVDMMIDLGLSGAASLMRTQRQALSSAGVDVPALFLPGRWVA